MAEDTRIGTQVAGYRIEGLIGRGGMGAVYLARHLRLGRMVALKLLAPELAGNQKFRDRFLRESKVAASIDHPNIVPIYDADEADGVLFLAMRYVDGTDLRGLIVSEGRIDPARTAAIAQQLGDALDVAHGHGLVHRDVKPANVLITPRHDPTGRDHAYLSDFGLTKRALSVSGLTQTGQIVGTIDYVAPEQVKGDPVDGRADQYSMGCLLYQCLSGSVPFPRDIEVAVLWAHVQDPPPSLVELGLGKQVDAAIGKALAKEPKDRFETCGELASSLSEAVGVTSMPGRVRRVRPKLAPGRQARGPAPVRLMGRHPAMAIVVALALVAAVAVPTTIALRGGGPGERIAGDAVAMIDLESRELMDYVQLDSRPGAVAVGEESVWVTLPDRGRVIEIDPEDPHVIDTIPVGTDPVGIAVANDSVWVANAGSSNVYRISSGAGNAVVDKIPVLGGAAAIAVGPEGVWVANSLGDTVSQIDPVNGQVQETIPVEGDQPVALAVDQEDLWVANAGSGTLSLVSGPAAPVLPAEAGNGPQAIAAGLGAVWVANFLDGTVDRIDPSTRSTEETFQVGDGPSGLAITPGGVWVSNASEGSVEQIDPETGPGESIQLGSETAGIAAENGTLWVGVRGPELAHRGGTLRVTSLVKYMDSIDPALAYFSDSWILLRLTYDGLLGFRRVAGVGGVTLVPNLATEVPDPTGGGKTYTFQLRTGIRYSSGDPVMPEDFQWAIERLFEINSPGASYFTGIKGADRCKLGDPCDLSSGIVADDDAGTVTFQLVRPDPEFEFKLTTPFAFAVPVGIPAPLPPQTPVPATGPYVIDHYTVGREIVLIRNPEFRPSYRPDGFPDRIVWGLGPGVGPMVADTLRGRTDLMVAPLGRKALAKLGRNDAEQLHLDQWGGTGYLFLNVRVPPLNDPNVRRALNYAIDREAIDDDVFGARGFVTCQMLPPTLPGYRPYCPYTSDPDGSWSGADFEKAKKLVDRSGTAGSEITVWSPPPGRGPSEAIPVADHVVELLKTLGYDPRRVRGVSSDVQVGYGIWGTDYPAESGFMPPLVACDSFFNFSRFCDPEIDARMRRASRLATIDPQKSHELWSQIEHDLVDRAPFVPLVNTQFVTLASNRLGNFLFSPALGPLIDQMWVR
jgi:ABC-type transport system substrate-binding protein/streptogramin lyase